MCSRPQPLLPLLRPAASPCSFFTFVQAPNRLLPVVGASLLVFWLFHVGVSALHACLISHPAFSRAGTPIVKVPEFGGRWVRQPRSQI